MPLVSTRKLLFLKHPLSIWKSDMGFATDLEINQLRAVNLLFKPWASLRLCGEVSVISSSTLIGLVRSPPK